MNCSLIPYKGTRYDIQCVTIKRFTEHIRHFSFETFLLRYPQRFEHPTITGPTKKVFAFVFFFILSANQDYKQS